MNSSSRNPELEAAWRRIDRMNTQIMWLAFVWLMVFQVIICGCIYIHFTIMVR